MRPKDLRRIGDIIVDNVQFGEGNAVYRTDDPQELRACIRAEARRRKMRIRTGIAESDTRCVYAHRPDEELDYIHQRSEEMEDKIREAIDRALRGLPIQPTIPLRDGVAQAASAAR